MEGVMKFLKFGKSPTAAEGRSDSTVTIAINPAQLITLECAENPTSDWLHAVTTAGRYEWIRLIDPKPEGSGLDAALKAIALAD